MHADPLGSDRHFAFNQFLFETTRSGVLYVNGDGLVVAANPAARQILGLPITESQGPDMIDAAWDPVDAQGSPITTSERPLIKTLSDGQDVRDRIVGIRVTGRDDRCWLKLNVSAHAEGSERLVVITLDDITASLRQEQDQRHAAEAFRHSAHGIAVSRPASTIPLVCNEALARSRGYTVEELTALSISDMYLPEDRPHVQKAIEEADRTGQARFEARIIRKDGAIRWVQMDVATVRDDAGRPQLRVATQQDITDKKQSDTKIRQLYRLYATLSQINQTIVRTTSRDGLFEAVCRLSIEFGEFQLAWIGSYDEQSGLISLGASSQPLQCTAINVRQPPHATGLIGTALRSGATVHASGAAAEGLRCWDDVGIAIAYQSVAIVPIRTGGRVVGLLALYAADASFFTFAEEIKLLDEIGLDISFALGLLAREARRAEDEVALAESEAALRKSQAISHVGHWSWDTRTNQLLWSDEMHRIFGVAPGHGVLDLNDVIARAIHPDDRALVDQANAAVIHEQAPTPMEYRVIWPDGSVHTVWAQPGEAIHDANGAIVRLTGIVQDITERKAAETRIRQQAERLKILADASNDFANAFASTGALLEKITQRVSETLHGSCHIRLPSEDGERLDVVAVYDPNAEALTAAQALLASFSVRLDEPGIGSRVFVEGRPAFIPVTTPEQSLPPAARPAADLVKAFPMHSVIAVPMSAHGSRLGVMIVVRHRRDQPAFVEEDLRLLQDLADRAALTLANARLFDQVQRELAERERGAEALRESESRLQTVFEASPDAVFISDPTGRFLDVNPVAVERYGYSREEILTMTAADFAPAAVRERVEVDLLKALEHGQPTEWRSRKKDGSEIPEEIVLRPFFLQGRPAVYASVRDISERVLAQQRLQLQLRRLSALRAIDQMITSNLDIRPTLNVLLDQVVSQLGVDAAAILLFNGALQTLDYAAGRGFRNRVIEHTRLRLGQDYAGRVGLERRVIFATNVEGSNDVLAQIELVAHEGFAMYCGVPLVAKGRLVGVLEVFHRSLLDPAADWRDFLETLAGQAAIAIDDVQLFNDLQRSNTELKLAYDATIEGWSRAMDLRDKETEGHTQRVTELTVRLAIAAGMGAEQIAHVRRGALLHDIGKLGVPDRILLKPDALTDEEWAVMRRHPQYAYDMLSSIEYLRPALDIPYCHHEKWDGTGYPRGLKGEQIPLAARIFMVADVWDALRSDRPYRSSWSEADVLAFIRKQSGSHFDPKAVDLFFRVTVDRQREP